ncbi:hypothetical protein LY76DRAFT_408951 [Colletotrichum caudatum]|nr:hypothetical protein LY76DRAFT_408951 [Colletotrichum caudatum]
MAGVAVSNRVGASYVHWLGVRAPGFRSEQPARPCITRQPGVSYSRTIHQPSPRWRNPGFFFLYPACFCHPPSSTRYCDGTPAFPGSRAPSPRMSEREAKSRHGSSMTLASPTLFARFCTWMQACWKFGSTRSATSRASVGNWDQGLWRAHRLSALMVS